MTQHDHDPFAQLDQRARAASDGLRAHVLQRLDGAGPVPEGPPPRSTRGPLVVVATVLALLVGSVVVAGQNGSGDHSRLEVDEALPDLEPGQLRPLGPRDGKDSIQLPVTVDPSAGVADGDLVAVRGEGFVPGEQVGIVQCAREAGGATPEVRGGVDACNIGDVVYADAGDDGVVSGTFRVRRVLTTPMTGTVDCAAEAERCIIGVGAISDYDRSGGHALTFVGGGDPIELPTVTVTPTEGLAHGEVVHVASTGLTPDGVVGVEICSADPLACWSTGEEIEVTDAGGQYVHHGLQADDQGSVEGEVAVWRFLPGPEPGTYVDCAVSRCSLRLTGDTAPPTVPLQFEAGGEAPVAPALSVEPSDGLAPGDIVLVRGAGFEPGTAFYISLCAGPPGEPAGPWYACGSSDSGDRRIDRDGTFAVEVEIPALGAPDDELMATTTVACAAGAACEPDPGWPSGEARCDDVHSSCAVVVELMWGSVGVGPPAWAPPPVPVTFR